MMLVDTHCHLDTFDNVDSILCKAEACSVGAVVAVSQDLESMRISLDIRRKRAGLVWPCVCFFCDHCDFHGVCSVWAWLGLVWLCVGSGGSPNFPNYSAWFGVGLAMCWFSWLTAFSRGSARFVFGLGVVCGV